MGAGPGIISLATPDERKIDQRTATLCMAAATTLHLALAGDIPPVPTIKLTAREIECLKWKGKGLQDDQVADRLGINRRTVEDYLTNARRVLDTRTTTGAVVKAIRLGYFTP